MSTKFSEDAIPLADLIKHATDTHGPVLLTSRGRGVAVMQAVTDYGAAEEERAFMRAVVGGLANIEGGRELAPGDAKARHGSARLEVAACRRSPSDSPNPYSPISKHCVPGIPKMCCAMTVIGQGCFEHRSLLNLAAQACSRL